MKILKMVHIKKIEKVICILQDEKDWFQGLKLLYFEPCLWNV